MCRHTGHPSSACRSWFIMIPIASVILIPSILIASLLLFLSLARSGRNVDRGRQVGLATVVMLNQSEVQRPLAGGPPRPSRRNSIPLAAAEAENEFPSAPQLDGEIAEDTQDANTASALKSSSWTDAPQELSVEPGTLPLLPEDAPAWIGSLPDYTGQVHHLHVGGLVADSEAEAATLLDDALVTAVKAYVETQVLERTGAAAALSHKLTADYVWKNLIDDRQGYMARLNTSGQSRLFQKWVTVSITPQQRQEIMHWAREATQRKRLEPIGIGMVGLLGCVGLIHLLLKVGKPR